MSRDWVCSREEARLVLYFMSRTYEMRKGPQLRVSVSSAFVTVDIPQVALANSPSRPQIRLLHWASWRAADKLIVGRYKCLLLRVRGVLGSPYLIRKSLIATVDRRCYVCVLCFIQPCATTPSIGPEQWEILIAAEPGNRHSARHRQHGAFILFCRRLLKSRSSPPNSSPLLLCYPQNQESL